MTSGLPPDAAVRLRAGALGPPAVASVLSLPVLLVFVGTVLLSLVLRWGRVLSVPLCFSSVRVAGCGVRFAKPCPAPDAPDAGGRSAANAPRRATVSHSPAKGPGATHR